MGKLMKDSITLKGIKMIDVYTEVFGFMAAKSYYLNQSVEPVKIVGKKKIQKGNVILDSHFSSNKTAELHVGLWPQGKDLIVVLDFSKEAASDADTIKGIIMHQVGQEQAEQTSP
jgi:hypothetical protein